MNKPTYTIIIPHKNSPEDLQRCLRSIPDIKDIQVIVVDDNSDNIDEEKFPGRERKFTQVIFNHDALGAGHARNIALKEARGEWLLFADADDYFVDNMYELASKNVVDTKADIIFFTLIIDREGGGKGGYVPVQNHCAEHLGEEGIDIEYDLRYRCTQPWDKLIRHSLVKEHSITFQETSVSNDYLFSVQTGYYAKEIKLVNEPLYIYVIRNNNSLWHISNYPSLETRIKVYCDVIQFQREHGVRSEMEQVYSILAEILYSFTNRFLSQVKYVSSELGESSPKLLFISFITMIVSLWKRAVRKLKRILGK